MVEVYSSELGHCHISSQLLLSPFTPNPSPLHSLLRLVGSSLYKLLFTLSKPHPPPSPNPLLLLHFSTLSSPFESSSVAFIFCFCQKVSHTPETAHISMYAPTHVNTHTQTHTINQTNTPTIKNVCACVCVCAYCLCAVCMLGSDWSILFMFCALSFA